MNQRFDYKAYELDRWHTLNWVELGFDSFKHIRRNLLVYASRNNLKVRVLSNYQNPSYFCFQFSSKEPEPCPKANR